jgi:hypothetical protein
VTTVFATGCPRPVVVERATPLEDKIISRCVMADPPADSLFVKRKTRSFTVYLGERNRWQWVGWTADDQLELPLRNLPAKGYELLVVPDKASPAEVISDNDDNAVNSSIAERQGEDVPALVKGPKDDVTEDHRMKLICMKAQPTMTTCTTPQCPVPK